MKSSGIYSIASRDYAYIGSTTNFDRRWKQHQEKLTKGDHSSQFLQAEFDRVGLRGLRFSVLERCSPEDLEKRERHWIAKYYRKGRALNVVVPGHPRWNQPLRRKTSKAKKKKAVSAWWLWLWLWVLLGSLAFWVWGWFFWLGSFIGGLSFWLCLQKK